nr:hypothetical protein [Streptomyces alboflavus]
MHRLLDTWAEVAAQTAAALRAEADPSDPRAARLVAELERDDEEFRRLWARHEARPARDELKRFARPGARPGAGRTTSSRPPSCQPDGVADTSGERADSRPSSSTVATT